MTHGIDSADLAAALPDVITPQRFATLRSGAVIRRDRWGIPHIRADDEYDLFFAQGFATAQDRLFQMDFDRLRALGRAAEYLGSSALEQDRLMRRRRMERIAKLDYELAGSAARNAIDAYADGVNAFLDSTRSLPVEYKLLGVKPEAWSPWHCIAVYKVRNSAEGTFQGKVWLARLAAQIGPEKAAKLSPGYAPGSLLTVPPGTRFTGPVLDAVEELRAVIEASSMLKDSDGGSNGWAISGDRTASGLPLVAGDPHRGLDVPNVYYQVHLIGADFAVLGYSIAGMPMALHFCHNEHVGWGMTHGGVDTQDLFVERFRDTHGRLEYLYRDEWRPADVAVETLRVRRAAHDIAEHEVQVVETHHGPVIAGEPRQGAAITLADPGSTDATRWIDAAYHAMKAKSADEFEAALCGWTDRVNNYPYADVHGNFGYALRGRIPIRGSVNGWGPVPGWTGLHEWNGYIPPSELPRSRNPASGWVVSCNQRIVDESYPYYLTHFAGVGYRAERIAKRIEALAAVVTGRAGKAGVADMTAIHGDVVSIPAQSVQKALARLNGLSGAAAGAAQALLQWDCVLTIDSAEAALYEATVARFIERLAKGHYGPLAADLLEDADAGAADHWRRHLKGSLFVALEQGDESFAPAGECWASLLSASLEAAVEDLERRWGSERSRWRWGELHRTVQQHPLAAVFPQAAALLNPPAVEVPGDYDTPFLSSPRIVTDFMVYFGPVARYVYDPSNWSNGRWIVPLGASGHPGSHHYTDQQTSWAAAQTIPQLWEWDEIGRMAESEQILIRP